jgi:hypothetical protein
MLYESLSQPIFTLILFCGGIISGIIFDLKKIFYYLFKKNKIINQFLMFFCIIFAFFIYFFINLKLNFGQFRFFSFLMFFLAFLFERFFVENFLAKPLSKCYNKAKDRVNAKRKIVEKV